MRYKKTFGVMLLFFTLFFLLGLCIFSNIGNAVTGRPYKFAAKWGSQGSGDGQFISPQGIAVDSLGNVYVADTGNNRIQKFSRAGVFLAKWGSYGSGDDQLSSPSKIYLLRRFFVADYGNNCIKTFDNGKVERWFTISGLNGPMGMANITTAASFPDLPSGQDFLYIADSSNNRILVHDLVTRSIYCEISGFSHPSDIAYDYHAYVYVTDTGNHCIKRQECKIFPYGVASPRVNFVNFIGSRGLGDGQFISPQGIALDRSGNIYVADTGNNRIQKFSPDGVFLEKWGSYGSGDGQFILPGDVKVDKSGNVYVADTGNNRIQKFIKGSVVPPRSPGGL